MKQQFRRNGIQEQKIDPDTNTDAAVNRDRYRDRNRYRKDRKRKFDARKIIYQKSSNSRLPG
jgi:hypothetical protein